MFFVFYLPLFCYAYAAFCHAVSPSSVIPSLLAVVDGGRMMAAWRRGMAPQRHN